MRDGQPHVLVTQQNQGDPNNYLYFIETQNKALKNGFNRIVSGDGVTQEITKQSAHHSHRDTETVHNSDTLEEPVIKMGVVSQRSLLMSSIISII